MKITYTTKGFNPQDLLDLERLYLGLGRVKQSGYGPPSLHLEYSRDDATLPSFCMGIGLTKEHEKRDVIKVSGLDVSNLANLSDEEKQDQYLTDFQKLLSLAGSVEIKSEYEPYKSSTPLSILAGENVSLGGLNVLERLFKEDFSLGYMNYRFRDCELNYSRREGELWFNPSSYPNERGQEKILDALLDRFGFVCENS